MLNNRPGIEDHTRHEFGERGKHKAPLQHARMRKLEPLAFDADMPITEQVKIEGARSIRDTSPSAKLGFNPEQALQQKLWSAGRLDLSYRVDVVRLSWTTHWLRLAKTRDRAQTTTVDRQQRQAPTQLGRPVPEVGS